MFSHLPGKWWLPLLLPLLVTPFPKGSPSARAAEGAASSSVPLPPPRSRGPLSLEEAVARRRTARSFSPAAISLQEVAQLLWAAQGITEPGGFKRAVPSAGALYPLEIYLAAGPRSVEGLGEGVWRYIPAGHRLERVYAADVRAGLGSACLGQSWLAEAPAVFVTAAEYERCAAKYGDRAVRYTDLEAGAAAEHIFLQAGALGLSAGMVGAFRDDDVAAVLHLPPRHRPLLVMPVGYAR